LPSGEVRFLFQPAEETVGGAQLLIEAGALAGTEVQAIFGLHVDPELEVGSIGIHFGQRNAASDDLQITVRGRAGHGAYPTSGIDSVVVAAHLVLALQSLVSRGVDARESVVLTLGTVRGGVAPNVLAPEVVFEGTVRTVGEATRSRFLEKLREVAQGVGGAFGASVEVVVRPGYAPVRNHGAPTQLLAEVARFLLGPERVQVGKQPRMGVEDFGFYLERIPGSFYSLGVRNEARGIVHPAHSSRFDVDESAMEVGALLQASVALAVVSGFLDRLESPC
jgi:amidohydrolase